jgi:RNA polymerase sigma-70 factor (ECF subfamily)
MTNESLVERLKKKDETAFKEVMAMYKNQILNYLSLTLHDRDKAEELTQDTFVTVYFKIGGMRGENLKSWIFAIATNLARTEFRKMKFKKIFSLSDVSEANIKVDPTQDGDIMLEQTLALLPEKYRIPVIMRQVDNFSLEEISVILKKPIGTVKSMIFRGLEQLRHQLAPQNGGIHE